MKDLRQALLNVGFELISEQGFAGIGLMKIINAAGATKGSFYHHFKSKEDFGQILLQDYFERHLATLDTFLTNSEMTRQQRIQGYFNYWCTEKISEDFQIKCLVVKLAGEVSGTSNQLQKSINDGAEKIIIHMADFFNDGISEGDFSMSSSYDTSRALYGLWLGSTLLCALQKDRSILENAMKETLKLTQ